MHIFKYMLWIYIYTKNIDGRPLTDIDEIQKTTSIYDLTIPQHLLGHHLTESNTKPIFEAENENENEKKRQDFNINDIEGSISVLKNKHYKSVTPGNPVTENNLYQTTSFIENTDIYANENPEKHAQPAFHFTTQSEVNKLDPLEFSDFGEYEKKAQGYQGETTASNEYHIYDIDDTLTIIKDKNNDDSEENNQTETDHALKLATAFKDPLRPLENVGAETDTYTYYTTTSTDAYTLVLQEQEYYDSLRHQQGTSQEIVESTMSSELDMYDIEDAFTKIDKEITIKQIVEDESLEPIPSFIDNMHSESTSTDTNYLNKYSSTAPSNTNSFQLDRQEYNDYPNNNVQETVDTTMFSRPNIDEIEDLNDDISENPNIEDITLNRTFSVKGYKAQIPQIMTTGSKYWQGYDLKGRSRPTVKKIDHSLRQSEMFHEVFDTTTLQELNVHAIEDTLFKAKNKHFGKVISGKPFHFDKPLRVRTSSTENPTTPENMLADNNSYDLTPSEAYSQDWQDPSYFTEHQRKSSKEIHSTNILPEMSVHDLEDTLNIIKKKHPNYSTSQRSAETLRYDISSQKTSSLTDTLPRRDNLSNENNTLFSYDVTTATKGKTLDLNWLEYSDLVDVTTATKSKTFDLNWPEYSGLVDVTTATKGKTLDLNWPEYSGLVDDQRKTSQEIYGNTLFPDINMYDVEDTLTILKNEHFGDIISEKPNDDDDKLSQLTQVLKKSSQIPTPKKSDKTTTTIKTSIKSKAETTKTLTRTENNTKASNIKKHCLVSDLLNMSKPAKSKPESVICKRALSRYFKISPNDAERYNFEQLLQPSEKNNSMNYKQLWKDLFGIDQGIQSTDKNENTHSINFKKFWNDLFGIDQKDQNTDKHETSNQENESTRDELEYERPYKLPKVDELLSQIPNITDDSEIELNDTSIADKQSTLTTEAENDSSQSIGTLKTVTTPQEVTEISTQTSTLQETPISNGEHQKDSQKSTNNYNYDTPANMQSFKKMVFKKVYDIFQNVKPHTLHPNILTTENPGDIPEDPKNATTTFIVHWLGDKNKTKTTEPKPNSTKKSWTSRLPWSSKKSWTSRLPWSSKKNKETTKEAHETPASTSTTISDPADMSLSPFANKKPEPESTTTPPQLPTRNTFWTTKKTSVPTLQIATETRKYHVRNRVYNFDIYYSHILHPGNDRMCLPPFENPIYNLSATMTINNTTPSTKIPSPTESSTCASTTPQKQN